MERQGQGLTASSGTEKNQKASHDSPQKLSLRDSKYTVLPMVTQMFTQLIFLSGYGMPTCR